VLGYAVLPAHLDPSAPVDIYWDDRRTTATLSPLVLVCRAIGEGRNPRTAARGLRSLRSLIRPTRCEPAETLCQC
jgi:hypothetical protein